MSIKTQNVLESPNQFSQTEYVEQVLKCFEKG